MNSVSAEVIVERVMLDTDAYVLFSAHDQNGEYVRVKSCKRIDPAPGETYRVSGRLYYRPDAHGRNWRQIDCDDIARVRPSGALVGRWLERLPHVGEVRAQRLMSAFSQRLAEVLADARYLPEVSRVLDPQKPVLANKIAARIYSAIAAQNARHLSVTEELNFLARLEGLGVTDHGAVRSLWRLVAGPQSSSRLLRNPYLAASLMTWAKADHLGKALLKERADKRELERHPDRLLGAVDSAWRDILDAGDTAAAPEQFRAVLRKKSVDVEAAIALAIERRHIAVSEGLYRAPGAAWVEDDLAARLHALEDAKRGVDVGDWAGICQAVANAEAATGLALYHEQRAAVQTLLTLPVGVLQGGAGVGKTTVMKVLVAAWETLGGNVIMGALAGKAALQLSRGTSTASMPRLAFTVARLIQMLNDAGEPQATLPIVPEAARIALDEKTLLILDEASMLDTPSLRQLVALLPAGARLLLVGDCGQLPPVGIGRVFHDLVEEGTRVVTLTTARRQALDSPVPVAATQIREGRMPAVESWRGYGKGIYMVEDPARLLDLYDELSGRCSDVMVIAALRASVRRFNDAAAHRRRNAADADLQTIRLGPLATVAVGDPVVCTRNRYKDGLFNGLLGRVTEANPESVRVWWDGEHVARSVSREAGADIELAYAITCHRAQGSAARCVVVCVEDAPMVTREWVYTAITRTAETVIVVGPSAALERAIHRRSVRITGFGISVQGRRHAFGAVAHSQDCA